MRTSTIGRQCSNCHTFYTAQRKHSQDGHTWYAWFNDHKGGHYCYKCYIKLVEYPKRKQYFKEVANPKARAKWAKHRINIKGIDRRYDLRVERKGVCSWCKKSVAKGEIMRTNLHHAIYHDDDILKDTVEICPGCHSMHTYGHICDVLKDRPSDPMIIIGSTKGPWSARTFKHPKN